MPEIIHEIAQLDLPRDLVEYADVPSLIAKFNSTYKKLGGLKNARDKHEARGIGKKLLDAITFDRTLEEAQLDALQVQEDFSKSIAQMIVLSIRQAQYLERQQNQLSEQQRIIKQQTTSIENHNDRLEKQHDDLAKNNKELKRVVDDFVALKGFTHDEVKKLLDIAHKVEGTEDELHRYVEKSLAHIKEQVTRQVNDALESINTSISNLALETDKNITQLRDDAILQLEIAQNLISTLQEDLKRVETEAQDQLKAIKSVEDKQGTLGGQLGELLGATSLLKNELEAEKAFSTGVDQKLETLAKQFEQYQSKVNLKLRRLHIMLGASLAICLTGVILFRM